MKQVLIKSFEMKRPFMVWIGFISIGCSKVAKEGKSCPRLLVLQRVAQSTKSCSKVAEHNLFMPTVESHKMAAIIQIIGWQRHAALVYLVLF